ncbi:MULTISPECIES: caspase family protein [Cyanophyceae]|uniref:caspase family protein n=1 Tax=Cyanophyceae TaxID=3028117 RepID=UPI001688E235|nr:MULTISPECIES: caspase family protein [Cyanophyceae]MBD1916135.1 caspase family protein [Phormidium sp. FACHB-77]MBD2031596.1 caspase family protein [Phormidium sp. FACHB-322]MBD2052777.1 caspase family protein [Leptolyngbya sp. FACHB-60]
MASHWPVIVGINQYQSLQPLMYAQFDALELRDFLVAEVGLPAQYCSLLTDISAVVYEGAAAPTREVLLQRLAQSCDRAGPEDTVWFFFSGYGVQWQGKDYLLPIDADPNRIEQTGILVETLLDRLAQGNQRQSIVMLDMNRPQSALSPAPGGGNLGDQTLALAQELEISLVLSCQPNQFSQETLAVRHGLFTEALIEGMRFHGCLTLAQLVDYLCDRVPELCQHHWRPVQNPVAVVPSGQQYAMLVPPSLVGQMPLGVVPQPEILPEPQPEPGISLSVEPSPSWPVYPALVPVDPPNQEFAKPWPPAKPLDQELPPGVLPEVTKPSAPSQLAAPSLVPSQRWGILAAGLLLLGVLWLNQDSFVGGGSAPEATAPSVAPPEGGTGGEVDPAAETVGESLFPGAAASGAEALARARTALDQRQFGEALSWLTQIPEGERPEDYEALVNQAEMGYANAELSGGAALNQARRLIEPVSASLFNDAIEQARQVPVGDPAYDQAQTDIERWSLVILDLAEGRAAAGDLDAAISAARLVPEDQGETWGQAQARIQKWEQSRVNRQLLQEAQSLLQPDQATSFQAAITLAQQIPPNYPESAIAQERIDQWSRDILAIARARAASGQIPGAISAAGLVPPGTSAYDQAQQEIQQWQGQ